MSGSPARWRLAGIAPRLEAGARRASDIDRFMTGQQQSPTHHVRSFGRLGNHQYTHICHPLAVMCGRVQRGCQREAKRAYYRQQATGYGLRATARDSIIARVRHLIGRVHATFWL